MGSAEAQGRALRNEGPPHWARGWEDTRQATSSSQNAEALHSVWADLGQR